ncbi:hypothetical protein GC174_05835 [bacterium]|nr:hypothetical protein [bacterium]
MLLLIGLLLGASPQANAKNSKSSSQNKKVPPLQALVPSIDKATPTDLSKLKLEGAVHDSYNPELIAIPKSDSVSAYEAGRKLYNKGDYARAMTAFEIAAATARRYGVEDSRYKTAKAAMVSTATKLTLRKILGYDTDNKNPKALTGKVTTVYPPSTAWLGGLLKDDQILSAVQDKTKNRIQLIVQRSGKRYSLNLGLKSRSGAGLDKDKTPGPTLTGKINYPELLVRAEKQIGLYDCVLMLDCSGSMGDRIISSNDRQGVELTRFDWCRKEMLGFYQSGQGYFPEGITLVPFANKFAIVNQARTAAIQNLFNQLSPVGGTNMAHPLSFLIDDYFARKARNGGRIKPLVIAILSDGEGNAHILRQLIIKTTQRMQYPKEILITFLAVDATDEGRPVIEALDNNLVQAGARYDIVDSRTFEELKRYGLLKMVVAALLEQQVERD